MRLLAALILTMALLSSEAFSQDNVARNFNKVYDEYTGMYGITHINYEHMEKIDVQVILEILYSNEPDNFLALKLYALSRGESWVFHRQLNFLLTYEGQKYRFSVPIDRYGEHTLDYDTDVYPNASVSEVTTVAFCSLDGNGFMSRNQLRDFCLSEFVEARIDGEDQSVEAYIDQKAFLETLNLFQQMLDKIEKVDSEPSSASEES